jgi:hypothetical protein
MTLSRATTVLRRQLGLRRGAGLVADEIATGSAAARAGFIQHDVLVRLDDQILVLPEQLDALLEAAEPGDLLGCTVLRGGEEVVIQLGQPGSALAQSGQAAVRSPSQPPAEPARRTGSLRPTASSLAIVAPVQRPANPAGELRQLGDETLVRHDHDFHIRLSRGDQTHLTVTDPTGRIVFQGGIDAAADRGRVPLPVRARVVDMEKMLEPWAVAAGHVVPTSDVAAPSAAPVARIGQLDVPPVELR